MNAQMRPAQPDAASAAFFAQGAESAADGLYSAMFGKRADAVLHGLFMETGNEFSHQHTGILWVEDAMAGVVHTLGGAERAACQGRTNRLFMRYGWPAAWRLMMTYFAIRPILDFFADVPHDQYYIEIVAIAPDYRGRGLSRRLLEYAEARAREAGYDALALDVKIGNEPAWRSYLAFGFEETARSEVARLGDETIQMARLVKPLVPQG
ncbi:MAG: GNAT family N-acetyltransferase [Anaerolineales bacterium]